MVFDYWDKAPIEGDFWLTGGMHWTGYWSYVVKFPYNHQGIEFSNIGSTRDYARLNTRTKEGLDLSISFSFTYQFVKEKIPELYRACETECKDLIAKIARNSVLETGGTWRAPDYWLNRDAVGESMRGNLTNSLESMGVAVKGFMLLKIDLPNTYEAAIVRTEVVKQEETTYMIERSIAATR